MEFWTSVNQTVCTLDYFQMEILKQEIETWSPKVTEGEKWILNLVHFIFYYFFKT